MKFIKFSQLPPPLWCAIFDICPELGNVLLLWWCPLWKPTRPLAPPGGSRFWLLCCKERDISAADVTQVRSSRLEHLESNNKIKIDSWFLNMTKEDYLRSDFSPWSRNSTTNHNLNNFNQGTLFLSWFLGVFPFNKWLISCWEENNYCYKLSNWQNDRYFHSKWQLRPFWLKEMSFRHFLSL